MKEFSRNELGHLIYLLNCEYKKNKQLRNKILSTISSFRYPRVKNINDELDLIKTELAANRLLVNKLEDILSKKSLSDEGFDLDDLETPNFLGVEASRHLKLLTTKPQHETD